MFDSSCHGSGGRPHQRSLCPGTAQEAGDANVMKREAQLLQRLPSLHCLLLPWARSARARTRASQPAAHGPWPATWPTQPQLLTERCPSAQSPVPSCPSQGHSWATGTWCWSATMWPQFPTV